MRKIVMLIAAFFIFTTFIYTGIAFAKCGSCMPDMMKEGEIINSICPVMGSKVDKDAPYKVEYKGKTIGLCCDSCVEQFKANPEKYMDKLDVDCTVKCPKCGVEIDVTDYCKKNKTTDACPLKEKTD